MAKRPIQDKEGDVEMADREQILKEIYESAFQNEKKYTGCAQTVLAALQERFPEITPEVTRSANGLAGGVARHGESCGALIGAIMGVSAVTGRQRLDNMAQYQKSMDAAMRVFERFKNQIGSTICGEIHKLKYGRKYDLTVEEERMIFRDVGCRNEEGCPVVCGTAARISADIILDAKDGEGPESK